MKALRNTAIALTFITLVAASLASAQAPLRKTVLFSINVPYEMRMTNYMLPEGNYIIRQMDDNDINLFALYKDDMRHSPIAMIRTAPIDYSATRNWPSKTELLIREDESSPDATPILRGFVIPGDSGFQIISVVPKNSNVLVRVN